MASVAVEVVGWVGTACVLVAYFLLTKGKLTSASRAYQALNLIGALLIGTNSLINRALPSVGVNVVWSIIALYGLWKALSAK